MLLSIHGNAQYQMDTFVGRKAPLRVCHPGRTTPSSAALLHLPTSTAGPPPMLHEGTTLAFPPQTLILRIRHRPSTVGSSRQISRRLCSRRSTLIPYSDWLRLFCPASIARQIAQRIDARADLTRPLIWRDVCWHEGLGYVDDG